jgi:hypothetical protein
MNITVGRCSESLIQGRPAGDGGETDEPQRCDPAQDDSLSWVV